jgi:DNA-binding transcriptional MerR regulator
MIENDGLYSIGAVERDTGIGRDTLRVWERRYGFPEPVRSEKGERKYSEKQLRQLQRIRRLLDQGMRPGKLLPLGEEGLDELEGSLQSGQPVQLEQTVSELIEAIHSTDVELLESLLQKQYQQQGMQGFILKTVVPLLNTVGEFWARGKLQIFQEHFLSQQLIRFLNTEIARLQRHARKPRVLLATLPGEEHTLGLLMVAAMLSSHGVVTINIGAGVPMDQIGRAVEQFNVDIVGITFSGAYQYKNIRPHLIELRELIPDDIEIWTGGEGVRRLRKLPVGVTKFSTLEKLPL